MKFYDSNLKILKVCYSWQEKLWAHLKVFIDLKEQTFLKERLNNFDVFGFDLEDEIEAELDLNQNENLQLPNEYWKQEFSNLSEVIISAIGTDADKYGKLVRSILTNNTELILNALDEFVNLDNSKNFEITARFAAHFGILNQNVLNKFIPIYSSQLINLIKKEVNKSEDMMSDFVKNKLPEIFEILPFYLSKICDKDLQLEYFGELIACAGDDVELRDNVIENGLAYDIDVQKSTTNIVEATRKNIQKSDDEKIKILDLLLLHSDQRYEALKQINALARYFILAENKTDKLIQVLNKLPKNTLELIKKQHIQNDEALTGYDINSDIDEYLSYIIYKNIILNFDSYISVKSRPKSDKIKISDLQIYGKKFVKSVEDIIKYPDGFMTSVMFKFEDFDSSQVNFILSADLKAELQQRNSELLTIRKLVLSKFIFLMLNTLIEINLNQQVLNSCVELVKLRKHLSDCLDSSDWKKIMEIVQTASLNRLKNV